jgi:putative ABC transport system ATP-binding protein
LSSNNNKFAVEVNDLVKTYRTGSVSFRALDGLSLKVRKGDIVSIVGPSGSGKSTLLNMIGLLDKPSSGTVLIDGVNVSKLDEDRKAVLRNKKIGFVFQAYNLIHRLTAIENVELPLIALGIRREVRRQRAKKLMDSVGLSKKYYNHPYELSGGEQQRVALSRALVADPALVLGDEITGNVDTKTSVQIMDLVESINKSAGMTFALVTHNPELARRANRIFYVRDGLIEKEETLS